MDKTQFLSDRWQPHVRRQVFFLSKYEGRSWLKKKNAEFDVYFNQALLAFMNTLKIRQKFVIINDIV